MATKDKEQTIINMNLLHIWKQQKAETNLQSGSKKHQSLKTTEI